MDLNIFSGVFARGEENLPDARNDGKQALPASVPDRKEDRLVLRQVYLWNDFHFDGDAQFGDNRLPGLPEHYYRAELLYEHPSGFYAGPNVEWVPRGYNVDSAETEFTDSYALLGCKIGYRSERGFSVFIEAKNLTDETYAATTGVVSTYAGQSLFFPGDGRGFYAGVEWKW